MLFLEPDKSKDLRLMSTGQVEMFFRENEQVLVVFASLRVENDVAASDILVVCEVLNTFMKIFVTCLRNVKLSLP